MTSRSPNQGLCQSFGEFLSAAHQRPFLVSIPPPHTHTCRRHRPLPHSNYLARQLVQIPLVARRRAKRGEHLLCIVLTAIEPPVNRVLHAAAQRIEQRGDGEGRKDDGYIRP